MIIEKIAIYAAITLITATSVALGVIVFGTLKFLIILNKVQKKLIAINAQIAEAAKEATSLQNDLAMQRRWLLHNKCSCMRQSETNILNEEWKPPS